MSYLYLLASLMFIIGLKELGAAPTARRGNTISAVAMGIAILGTVIEHHLLNSVQILSALLLGSVIGIVWANRVKMTGMPQLVAILNGFGGLASMIVGWAEMEEVAHYNWLGYITLNNLPCSHLFNYFLLSVTTATVFIGAITFSGSLIAFGKLAGWLPTRGLQVPCKFLTLLASFGFALIFIKCSPAMVYLPALYGLIVFSLIVGALYILPIGGGDMPVVISLLNSLSGLAAACAGFVIGNVLLIVAGSLVGASGLILTLVMCKSMNRSLLKVLFHQFGEKKDVSNRQEREPRAISLDDAYYLLEAGQKIFVVPGYGMAVAQAQHAIKALSDLLEENGADVHYVVHPVAGRMPGHMNVLLAEANVSYDKVVDMESANREMDQIDVAIIIGANDIVNPAARENPGSPIYGMPVIEVSRARTVLALKRGSGRGFSGLENALFSQENTVMLYGDAKETLTQLVGAFRNASN